MNKNKGITILIGIIITTILITGCAVAYQEQQQHSVVVWSEDIGYWNTLQKITDKENNVTCYTLIGSNGRGISCLKDEIK
jgi:hypothetical protein